MVVARKCEHVNSDQELFICLNDQLLSVKGVAKLLDALDQDSAENVLVNNDLPKGDEASLNVPLTVP